MQNSEQRAFIELNRRFRKLKPKAKSEEAAVESYTTDFLWGESSLSWDTLLEENRAVVLGEPGSGKSWEFRERARLLADQGKFAFFVRLDQLVERDLHSLLTTDEKKNFLNWKKGNEVGRFFLDSVDEAKFHKVSDFHAALNRFRNELGSDLLLRTKIFLSSRISEWKPSTDSFEFQRLFPQQWMEKRTTENQSQDNPKKPELLVVQIEPLNRDQVERLARANGVSNVEAFSKELDQTFAWEFARRPLDVSDLVAFWLEKGRIGSLTELIEFDISSKLSPRAGRDEYPLSETEGHEGAEWLAAASLFSRRFSFYVPDDGSTDEDSLSPRACLPPNWRDDQMRALLNRAIFDSAAYGHLRFHHRRVGEYLAAKWLAARMDKGCPPHELEQIFVEVDRSSGAYSPIDRDYAQKFRNVLLSRLENDEDSAATDVLRELADEPAMSQVRDWILNLLEKRLVNEADFVPWKPADIRDFAENHEVDPKNDKELFAIVRKRLQGLKWDVEKSDNSLRDELRKDDREIFLRRWLQRRLMERSQKRYNVPQEEEIDQQERPDLRVENPKINGPVSIEVKWADSWTVQELLEGLEMQLVGQYLRAHNSQYGFYLLGFVGKKQSWQEPITGKLISFAEVVEIISQKAVSLVRTNPKIARLEVLSIDFRQPN